MWGRTEVHRGFGWGNLRERHPFDGLGGDRKVILKWILKQPVREGDWIGLILVNTVMEFWSSVSWENLFLS
jgi:hypothetical protein